MSDTRVPEFDKVFFISGRTARDGRLRLAAQGVGWKPTESGSIVTIEARDIKRTSWLRVARNYQLRIVTAEGETYKFENLQRDGFELLRDTIKANYHLALEVKEMSLKGWNWGKPEVRGDHLMFVVGNRPMFEIPFAEIANTNASKNEVTVELVQPETTGRASREDQLVECRFYVPGLAEPEEDGLEPDGDSGQTAAEALYEIIKSKADVDVDRSDVIVSFKDLPFHIPRGRYDVDMFATFLRLRGKSYDYKIKYESIIKLFLLPKPGDLHVHFIMALDPPLRQGQTSYLFLVMQFLRDDELAVDLKLDSTTITETYEGKLQKSYDARSFEVVSAVFRGLTQKKVTVPGDFKSANSRSAAVKCSMKANEGLIYPLEKSLLFLYKPTLQIMHSEIGSVTFSRIGGGAGASRTIDLLFNMKTGVEHSFSNIAREEHAPLNEYMLAKKIRVKSELTEELPVTYIESDDEEESGLVGGAQKRLNTDFDDEDEESPDEDFVDQSSDNDVGEEYTSDYNSDPDAVEPNKPENGEPATRKIKTPGSDKPKTKKTKVDKKDAPNEYIGNSDEELAK